MPRSKGCLIAAALALAMIATVAALAYWSLSTQLDRSIQAIRDKKEPVTLAELDAWYPQIPESRNAAPGILRAYELMVKADPNSSAPFGPNYRPPAPLPLLPEGAKPDLARHLAANMECLAELAKASQLPECRYPYSLSADFESRMAHVNAIYSLCKLQAAHSVYSAETGNMKAALESASRVLWLAETLRTDPFWMCQRARWDCHAIGVDAINFAIAKGQASDVDLASLQQYTLSCESKDAVYRGVVMERCLMAATLEGDTKSEELVSEYGLLNLLDAANKVVALSQLERVKRRDGIAAITAKLEDHSISKRFFAPRKPGNPRPAPVWTTLTDVDDCDAALLRITSTAIAVERFRVATGRLPQSLEELVPTYLQAIPEDPFDAKPLRFVPKDSAFSVYSVGWDRIDDGGTLERRRNKNIGDITIAIMR